MHGIPDDKTHLFQREAAAADAKQAPGSPITDRLWAELMAACKECGIHPARGASHYLDEHLRCCGQSFTIVVSFSFF